MAGERPQGRTEERASAPTWLRLGRLLALGQLLVVGLLILRADTAATPAPSISHLAGPGSPAPTPSFPPTTTTVLAPTTVPSAPPVPVTTLPPTRVAAPPAHAATTTVRGITPPAVPPANIAPQPNFLQSCSGAHYDDSLACVGATVQAISHARSTEGLPALTLPSNWGQLTEAQQTFVSTDLERTARGLAPMTAMATVLDQAATQGADAGTDPAPPSSFPSPQWGSNWAGAVGNPLEALYFWMYDDGVGSANVDCSASDHSGCWGHRQNVLVKLPCHDCVMGTGWSAGGYRGDPSLAEMLVETTTPPATEFSWQQESPFLS